MNFCPTGAKVGGDSKQMNLYGNVIWNNATPNSEKSILVIEQEKLKEVTKALDETGVNYCYYILNNQVSIALAKVAVTNTDLPVLQNNPVLKDLAVEQPKKDYTPQSPIIGNTAYRDIKNRHYQSLNTDLALKVADELAKKGIAFSGRMYGDNTTLTIDKKDRNEFEKVVQGVVNQRNSFNRKINSINEIKKDLSEYFSTAQINAFQSSIDLLYTNNEFFKEYFLYHFGEDKQNYTPEQLARYSKVFNEMFDQIDQMKFFAADMSKLSNLQKQIENEILFDELVYLKGFNAEQKDCFKKLIDMDISRAILDVIDYDFTPENIMQIADIVQKPDYYNDFVQFVADIKDIEVGTMHSLLNRNAYLADTAEFTYINYDVENYSVSENGVYTIPIETNTGLLNRLADSGLVLQGEQTKVFIQTNGNDFHRVIIPDFSQNTVNSIDTFDLFTDIEQKIFANRVTEVESLEQQRQILQSHEEHEPTEKEIFFNECDLPKLLSKSSLAWDEIEDLGYIFFEKGHIDKYPPNEKFHFGNGIFSEPQVYELARRYQNGEDISEELSTGLFGKRAIEVNLYYNDDVLDSFNADVSPTKDGYSVTYGEYSREVTFEEMSKAYLQYFQSEYDDIQRAAAEEEIEIFKKKTEKHFNSIDGYSPSDIEILVTEYAESLFIENEVSAEIVNVAVTGSRSRGLEDESSDIDVVLEVKSDLKEYVLFNILNEEPFSISDIPVDINPIRAEETGTLADYLPTVEKYLSEKAENAKKEDTLEFAFGDGETPAFTQENGVWHNNFSESDLLHDFVLDNEYLGGKKISFALANALMEYLDEKQHTERNIPQMNVGYYKKTDFNITATIDGEEFGFNGRFDIGDGKGTGGGSLIDHIRTIYENAVKSDRYPFNNPQEKEKVQRKLDIFVPFLEKNSVLTAEEQKIFDDFKEQHPIYQRENSFDKAIRLLNEFCENEYETKANFSNLDHIDIAYTTDEETDIEIQVYADLEKYRIVTEYGGKEVREELFSDIDDMAAALDNLDFSELVSLSDEEKAMLTPESTVEQVEKNQQPNENLDRSKRKFFLTENGADEMFFNSYAGDNGKWELIRYSNEDILKAAKEPPYSTDFFLSLYEFVPKENEFFISESDEEFKDYIKSFNRQADFEGMEDEAMWGLIESADKKVGRYTIYQLTDGEENHYKRFEGLDRQPEPVNISDYQAVYQGSLFDIDGENKLESIFTKFNMDIPTDFTGHSLSVSDVVVTEIDGEKKAYFCDRVGFAEIPDFFKEIEREQTVSSDNKIESAFQTLRENHTFTDEQSKWIDRIEKVSVNNNGIDTDMFENGAFKNAGGFSTIDSRIFEGSLADLIKEVQQIINPAEIETEQDIEQDNSELIREKNKAIIDSLVVGSKIILPENSWEITKINGDFSAEFKNLDENSIMSGHSYIGHWKENLLDEAGDNLIVVIDENEKAEQQTERSEAKNEVIKNGKQEFHQQTEKQSDQLKLDFSQPVPEEPPQAAVDEVPKAENFIIKDDNLGAGTQLERFKNNLAAISTLIELEQNNQQATPEQQEILSKYVGWGGLSEFFKETNPHYQELKSLLTEDEYSSARSTTLDSFYTSPAIIDSIYKVLQNSGFESGNILEPSMGVGNFFGRMPEEMQKNSKLFGVEIDGLTGRIAKQLYPNAHIQVKGFEKTNFKDSSFDVVVGNIPFGDFSLQYDKQSLKIHDYFFMKALDKVKEGGIVAFVTSKGTLDKKDSSFRKQLAEKADLLGAVRLPNTAFKTAGTQVTADIIFLQKRSAPPEKMPEWVNMGVNENGLPINQYFADNPDMVLGQIVQGNKMYGRNDDTMCIPFENADLSQQLNTAVEKIQAVFAAENKTVEPVEQTVQLPENLRNYSYFENKGNIYTVDNNSVICLSDKEHWGRSYTKANIDRAKDYIKIRDTVRELLNVQQEFSAAADERIAQLQVQLNAQYDDFYKKYGLLHNSFNARLFREDSSFPLMLSLEDKIDKDTLVKKSDIFFQRTIKEPKVVDSVNTAQEALVVSIAETGKVDLKYMSALSDIPVQGIINELKGEIFPVPELSTGDNIVYQTSSEYLSGDIYKKLEQAQMAAERNDIFKENVSVLEKVLPTPLQAGDIDIELGAAWVPPEYYQQFMYELFKTPSEYRADVEPSYWQRRSKKNIEITYSEHSNKWHISNKSVDTSTAAKDFGTKARNAYAILENVLNLHIPNVTRTVTDADGKKTTVMDLDATKLVKRKATRIQKAFKEWVYKDPTRRKELVDLYNRKFNCVRPRDYSAEGAALTFSGMSSNFELREHQKTAVAHAVYGGNTLLAHCVGAGKTFEMIAIAMESKRLGLCNKSLFAVPNHLTEQVGADFMKLYPSANVLVATKKDFTKQNRKKLLAKIATGNYDAVIIGHSQLGMIPMSPEREIRILQEQIHDISEGIAEMKSKDGDYPSIKEMERTKKSLKQKLEKLLEKPKDDMLHFEELGIDKLFVDEAHEFKNLMSVTKLRNVSGISGRTSQRATDLFMKCRYLDEITGGTGTVFATGTPISNSITELHTMMRYMMYDFLCEHGMQNFDNWVSVFGKQKTDYELAPTGDKFKSRTRIASYANMPELMAMFSMCADVKTSDMLNLPVPECQMHIVNAMPTQLQQELVQELSARADDVQIGAVDPREDNMLKITGDGRKVGLDPRLIDPEFEDDPNTKLNLCVKNVFDIYQSTSAEKLTQIIFCDLGVPKPKANNENEQSDSDENKSMAEIDSLEEVNDFCVYDDIKAKLVDMGVNPSEIAFIHDAKSETQKAEMFEKVRSGEIRVLIGSTAKMGTGTNVQDRLVALHDLDVPWRPADLEQRRGRMVRQGNMNKEVHLYRYVTKGTFDAYSYQILETKQRFISQIMTSKSSARTCQDVDQEALEYSTIKALCTGDERIKEKLTLENRVKELELFKKEYSNTRYSLEDKLKAAPERRENICRRIEKMEQDFALFQKIPLDQDNMPVFEMKLDGVTYTDRKDAAAALKEICDKLSFSFEREKITPIGEIHGFKISVTYDTDKQCMIGIVSGQESYTTSLSAMSLHSVKKLESLVNGIGDRLAFQKENLAKFDTDIQSAQEILSKPFEFEQELKDSIERLDTLTDELNAEAARKLQSAEKPKRTHYFGKDKIIKSGNKKPNLSNEQDKDKDKKQNKDKGTTI